VADIRLENLRKEFDDGAVVAVRDLSLTFREGTTTCLLGPSGCGKTTLMRIIAGLDTPTAGRVYFGDQDVTDAKTRDRDLGMVFQYPVVYRGATVRENVALPLRGEDLSQQEKDDRVEELISLIGLEKYADVDASRLNSATRQMVAVARAVSRQAPVILFDEPITNVDPDLKLQVKRTLRELFSRLNQTIIYVTHDQTEAMTLADEIALMNDGRIDQMAPPRELYNQSASRFSGWFLGNPGMDFVPVGANREIALGVARGPIPDTVETLGFRPEHVNLAASGSNGGIPGIVRHASIVTGGQILVGVKSGELLVKSKLPWNSTLDVRPGSEVWWSIDPAQIRMFDSSETAVNAAPDTN